MRLLDSTKMELKEFPDDRIPPYAILSHRWQDDEVLFQDMQSPTAVMKVGYSKLKQCCDRAVMDQLQYVWVDTCCIDKTSSAELSESINSMYRWYQNAAACYVYMFDVYNMNELDDSSFGKSVWFTRGWTLQELIAPSNVIFYSSTWHRLGTKNDLKEKLSAITGVDIRVLGGADPESFSIAKRMSWASKRKTTRIEDVAYSLLGLFGIYMPMLYGEGERAFIRLQEEIIKTSNDTSIFAWSNADSSYRGLLAKSPADFRNCRHVILSSEKLIRNPYSITNMGLSIELLLIPWAMDTYIAALDCDVQEGFNCRTGLFLQALPQNDQYARVMLGHNDLHLLDQNAEERGRKIKIYVQQRIPPSFQPWNRMYGFKIRKVQLYTKGKEQELVKAISWNNWDDDVRILQIPIGLDGVAGVLWLREKKLLHRLVLGFDFMFKPVCSLKRVSSDESHNPFRSQMDKRWLNESTHKGDRVTGMEVSFRFDSLSRHVQVKISEEVIENQRMWVVDIERQWAVGIEDVRKL